MGLRLPRYLLHSFTLVVLLLLCTNPLYSAIVLHPLESSDRIILTPIENADTPMEGPIPVCHIHLVISSPGFGTLLLVPTPLHSEGRTPVVYELRCSDGSAPRFEQHRNRGGEVDCGVVYAHLRYPLVIGRVYRSTVLVYLQVER